MKIGLVGAGLMGRTHAAAWAATPATLAGVVALEDGAAQALAAQAGAVVYPTLAAMLPHVDVVDICTPTYLHAAQVLAAAAAGKHIICEKPLALTMTDTAAMIAACEQAGVWLLVAQVVRFFPEYAAARHMVARGDIGTVAVTRLTRCGFKPARQNPQSWFHNPAQSGGMMLDLMVHDFDYARWLCGEVESVYARHIAPRFPQAAGDYALAILRHTSGAITHVEGGWAYPVPLFRTALEIAGSAGLIEHPAASSAPIGVYLHATEATDVETAVPASPLAEDPYTTEIRHFYDVLTGRAAPRVTAHDGAAAVQIALAAIESARTGRAVRPQEVTA
ncbi:MAG: Gfo/Idh/MocA family oxidoreductase [Anaerolineae bacterium]|nr:Gfo/Idh/MocA family oxidoreductase [Anaerolineae bacterium]